MEIVPRTASLSGSVDLTSSDAHASFSPVINRSIYLATYILVDRKLLKPKDNEPSALSAELPMSLPSCFKNGTPYADCAWNYDPLTGKKLSVSAPVAQSDMWQSCRGDSQTRKLCTQPWTSKEASI